MSLPSAIENTGSKLPVARAGGTRCAVRRRGYVLLETVVATGLLVVGLAVLGAQVQDAQKSVRTMERRIRAIQLAEQQLAELEMGLVELESVDEIEEGDFGPRYADFGWRLITEETTIEQMYLLQLEVLHHHREDEYKEDDFEYDDAEILHTVYAMRAAPQPMHLGEDFGLNEEELLDLSEKLAALGIPGLDPEAFDPRLFQNIDFEELVQSAPLILDALGMDLSDLMSMLPPDLLQQIEESGMLDGDEESEPPDDRGPTGKSR
jgi:hypothetical protein